MVSWCATRLALACAAALAVVVHTAPTLACSPFPTGLQSRGVIPFDKATAVATSTRVIVTYLGSPYEIPSNNADAGALGQLGSDVLLIEASTNNEVPVTITSLPWAHYRTSAYRLAPLSPLKPNTRYQVADRRGTVPCVPMQACASGERTVFASFETGDKADEDVPTFAGLDQLTTRKDVCESGSCCGPYSSTAALLSWSAASDSTRFVLYAVFVDNKLSAYTIALSQGFNVCGDGRSNPDYSSLSTGMFRVEAMDLSGNVTATMVSKAIPQSVCAGVGVPDSGAPDEDLDSGCGCRLGKSRSNASGAAAGVLLALAVLLGRGMRRRDASAAD